MFTRLLSNFASELQTLLFTAPVILSAIICVSLTGPVANFIPAFISLFLEGLLMRLGSDSSTAVWICQQLCYYSAVVNIGLGLFNLIPIPPPDGSKIVETLWDKAAGFYWKYQQYWRIVLIVCVLTGILSRPLGMLNELLIDLMWSLIKIILGIGILQSPFGSAVTEARSMPRTPSVTI